MTTTRLPDPPFTDDPAELRRWAVDLVETMQGIVDTLIRDKQSLASPTIMPIATVAELNSSAPKYKPSVSGGSRWVYAVDAFGGAIPVYSDGANWQRSDGGGTVS